jgi:hypothetical protein
MQVVGMKKKNYGFPMDLQKEEPKLLVMELSSQWLMVTNTLKE